MQDEHEDIQETGSTPLLEEENFTRPAALPFIVGVGASAGGLEAIQAFFDNMPEDSGAAFVVIQHLSPDYKSLMDELLAHNTHMEIHRVEDGMQIQANHIYLIPPRKDLVLEDSCLRLQEQRSVRGVSLPIDTFFHSMATICGPHCAAVILSGTGSDGSRGIGSVKNEGGLILVQEPSNAQFDGMPRAACQSVTPDYVLHAGEMPQRIERYIEMLGEHHASEDVGFEIMVEADPMQRILLLILREKGIDFRHYRTKTVRRRLQRRMTVLGIKSASAYYEHLLRERGEIQLLVEENLIGVTEFFRDAEAFRVLGHHVLPQLVERANEDNPIRVWVPGCSSGEEAYTIAMLLEEAFAERDKPPAFRVFATDLDPRAVARAGEGVYPSGIVPHLTPQQLKLFFEARGDGFQVRRALRERVVFAVHNLISDPPFTRMDLISCRNLLIYFSASLQDKAHQFLHFALKRGGFLLLGRSETLGDHTSEFEAVSSRWNLYRKLRDTRKPLPERNQVRPSRDLPRRMTRRTRTSESLLMQTCSALIRNRVAAALLVDANFELLHAFGNVDDFLRIPEGRVSYEATRMLSSEARMLVSAGITRAMREGKEVVINNVPFRAGERRFESDIRIMNLGKGEESSELFLLLIGKEREDPMDGSEVVMEARNGGDDRVTQLEQELAFTKENLQTTIEELETTNEELQSTNEELMASNEELQSTNEELHSVNEELYTVNAEHQSKITELHELNDDMDNLLRSTRIGTIFLDRELHIRRFTPAAAEVVNLLNHDIGRPLGHLGHDLLNVDLGEVARKVIANQQVDDYEVTTGTGDQFLLRVLPYRTARSSNVDGVVLTFIAIDQLKRAERSLRESEQRFRQMAETIEDVFYMTDHEGSLLYVSPSFQRIWGRELKERYDAGLIWLDPVLEPDRERLEAAAQRAREGGFSCEYRIVDGKGTVRWISDRVYPVHDENGEVYRMVGLARDVTANKDQEEQLRTLTRNLEAQANRDALTGLLNRRGIESILQREFSESLRSGERLVAVLVDLDRFKAINDTLGHAAGDVVLKDVGQRMSLVMRPGDTLARIGGDEFLVLLRGVRTAEAAQVAERVRLAVSDSPVNMGGRSFRVTASLGVASIPEDVVAIEEVLSLTHQALNTSKREGKNRIHLASENGATPSETHQAISVLGEAELEAYAQSIHDLRTGAVVGYEMLTRGPQGAYRNPIDFFRLSIEDNALTVIDLRCLKVCLGNVPRLKGNAPGSIHVNLYPSTLLETPSDRLISILEDAGGAKKFCLEISEQQFLGDPGYLKEPVDRLKDSGVQIAIDDVGFGRSSLESLIILEPDVVKVDRLFVHGADQDPTRRRNLERLIRATEALSAKIMAEGIESAEEVALLSELGIHYGQGFHWGHPEPVIQSTL